MTPGARLAVLGSPIAHSLSPALHAAAYRVLGLDWSYEAIEVPEGALGAFVNTLGADWRGLSLTMPLKREVLPMLDARTTLVEEVGAANTVLLQDGRMRGFNTDVDGIVGALADHGVGRASTVHVLGMGATAASALAAAARLGAREAIVTGRRDDDAELRRLAGALGIGIAFRHPGEPTAASVDLLVNTVPGDMEDAAADDAGAFLEVIYDGWPSRRAGRWIEHRRPVVSGLEMLLHQAVGQVRIFVTGDQEAPLRDEAAVVAAMRSAVDLG